MKTSEILIAARVRITDPKHWIQGVYHAVVDGENAYCSSGALGYQGPGKSHSVSEAYRYLARVIGEDPQDGPVCTYNDTHTHAEVLAMFDRAIELAVADEESK